MLPVSFLRELHKVAGRGHFNVNMLQCANMIFKSHLRVMMRIRIYIKKSLLTLTRQSSASQRH